MLVAAVLSAWVQYAADGKPHARALVPQTCPAVTYDGGSTPMRQRAAPAPAAGFDEVVCDAPLPPNARHVAVERVRLPSPPVAPRTIVVFGDTGCRMLDDEQQNCGDIADWPFPKIAQTIAAVHADLLVHVGDYYYRENNCPKSMTECRNRWGDTSMSWNADWFTPGKPIFASAPLIMIRGNHEDCQRGGPAWFRYLDGADAVTPCTAGAADGTLPWAASFGKLRIVVNDSAADPSDSKPDPARIAFLRGVVPQSAGTGGGRNRRHVVRHPPPAVLEHERDASAVAARLELRAVRRHPSGPRARLRSDQPHRLSAADRQRRERRRPRRRRARPPSTSAFKRTTASRCTRSRRRRRTRRSNTASRSTPRPRRAGASRCATPRASNAGPAR